MEGPSHHEGSVPPTVTASSSTVDLAGLVDSHASASGISSTWSDEVVMTPAIPMHDETKPVAGDGGGHRSAPQEHHGISGAFHHLSHAIFDKIHRHSGHKGTFIVFHLPHSNANTPNPSPSSSPEPSAGSSNSDAVLSSAIHPSASNASLSSVSSSVGACGFIGCPVT